MFEVIKKADVLAGIPEHWAKQYPAAYYPADTDKGQIRRKLYELDCSGEAFTAEQIDAIIGNSSWTSLGCDICDEAVDIVVLLGNEPDIDGIALCAKCLSTAASKLANATNQHTKET